MPVKRAALAILFGASAASFAATLPTTPAWAFVVLAVGSVFWTSARPAPHAARRFLQLALGVTLVYGWVLVIYPVMSEDTMRLWALVLGYSLGALGGFFLLTGSPLSIPTSIGLAAVSCFDLEAAVQPYLYVAGAAGFLYLAADVRPGARPRSRAVLVALSGALSAFVAIGIVLALPWTQGIVEETMMTVYSPASGGGEGEGRSRLGELRNMKLSSRVVMRVWSDRPQRLRSRALVRFDGRTWYADPSGSARSTARPSLSGLDEASRAFVDALPGADFVPDPESLRGRRLVHTRVLRIDGGGLATPGGSRLIRAPLERIQIDGAGIILAPQDRVWVYGVLHDADHRRAQEEAPDAAALEAALQVPEKLDPRIRELSNEIARGSRNREAEAVVDGVVSYLRDHYRYSLDIGTRITADPLAEFLFDTKRGWCEYFAGAAAILLRVQGIPTRYVRGLNVTGSQRLGDHYVVREWDRHAWIDVYLDGRGWIEYDPTPAAEYESLHAGLEGGRLSELFERLRSSFAELYARLHTFEWTSLVRPALLLGALFLLVAAAFRFARVRLRREKRRARGEEREPMEIERLANELDRKLVGLGCPRPASRAPLEHWRSLPEAFVSSELREIGRGILELYYRARFGGERIADDEVEALRRLLSESGSSS